MTDAVPARGQVSAPAAADVVARVVENLELVVRAPRETLELCVLVLVAEGHLIIEDFPGVGKTVLAKSLARSLDLSFSRLQFTPDLLPTDVTGVNVFNQKTNEFEFKPGPVFANVLLVDEINRASPKTQAALLEAMQEAQVTIDGVTYPLELPFLVLATQNPIEYEGTYPLPEAQLDRFVLQLSIGYPSRDEEWEIVERRVDRRADEIELEALVDAPTLVEMQRALEHVHVSESVGRYMVDIVTATRASGRVQVGASPRGTLALLKLGRGKAALAGRDFVTPDDVKAIAVPALAHRLTLKPELWVQRIRGDDVVAEALETVPTPPAEDLARSE
jgi:MoxR-like ATPase